MKTNPEQFKINFYLTQLFELYKDKRIQNPTIFDGKIRRLHPQLPSNFPTRELYLRIINYQIDRYTAQKYTQEDEYTITRRNKR